MHFINYAENTSPCPECHGNGYVNFLEGNKVISELCDRCGGEGTKAVRVTPTKEQAQ